MSAIAGLISSNERIGQGADNILRLYKMLGTLRHRGPNFSDIYADDYALIGQNLLFSGSNKEGSQSLEVVVHNKEYAIVLDGKLFNREEIDFKLGNLQLPQAESDGQAILLLYATYGVDCMQYLSGNFAFVIYNKEKKEYFLARDHLGVKPLFYAEYNKTLIFASEIKGLFASGLVEKKLDSNSYAEIFALSPSRTAGVGVYRGIYELRPAECAVYNEKGLKKWSYWQLCASEHTDNLEDTIEKVRALVQGSIEAQLCKGVCAFLSGGLDSSIIATVAAKRLEQSGGRLSTFSIDYEGNDKFFKSNAYLPDSDKHYALLMAEFCKSLHKSYITDSGKKLANSVVEAALARDLPGMADIDASLMLFCREIAHSHKVALSGECADEIFAGYPWYTRRGKLEGFPWSKSQNIRSYILKDSFKSKHKIDEYAQAKFSKSLAEAPLLADEKEQVKQFRQLQYLNIRWFMASLLERSALMGMHTSLEIRVPFCSPDIVQYAYNIPPDYLLLDSREKGLLRKAVASFLPKAIVYRKKSPYPKTFNPEYEKIIKSVLCEVLKKDSILTDAIDMVKLQEIMDKPSDMGSPWFGQLMGTSQLYGYLLQIYCLFG